MRPGDDAVACIPARPRPHPVMAALPLLEYEVRNLASLQTAIRALKRDGLYHLTPALEQSRRLGLSRLRAAFDHLALCLTED